MPRQVITTADAPGSPLFSQGVKAGPFVFLSGIVGIDPSTGSLAGETIQEQTRQALTNCEAILRAADFAGLNEEYARWFPTDPPTRYGMKLGVDVPGLRVSIRMTAYTG